MSLIPHLIAGYRRLQAAVALVADFDQVVRSQAVVRTRAEIERIVMLSVAADLVGLPLAPPDLTLRLMPHFVPHVYQWQRIAWQRDDITGSLQVGC